MFDEKNVLQVLAEQKSDLSLYQNAKFVTRSEESLFEFDGNLAQIVTGVRRSGKSTLCHKVLTERGVKYGFVNMDDDRLADIKVGDLNSLLSCIYQIYGADIEYLFLDEIQDVDGWYLFVNRLLRSNLHLFITGSNAKLLSGELATHLTGRYNEIRLYPFSFTEYCLFHNIDTKGITTKEEAICKQAFLNYLQNGGLPELQKMRNKRGYSFSLVEAIITKDIQKRFKIRNIDALRKIANILISNSCQEINYAEISKTLQIGDKTVKNYVDYLRQAFLIQMVHSHSFKVKERLRNPKSYVVDTGLKNNLDNNLAQENIGWRMENVVYLELLRRSAYRFLDIFYYKPTSQDKEVDFVLCDRDRAVSLIQVAFDISSPRTFNRETSALVKASKKLNCDNLTLITFSDSRDVVCDGRKIKIIPALDWLLEDGKDTVAL